MAEDQIQTTVSSDAFQRELADTYRAGYDAGENGRPFSWPVLSEVRADAWRLGWANGMLDYRSVREAEWNILAEAEKVVALVRLLGCWRLGNWDGCCCSRFSLRNVDIDISCGKGREQAVWISSSSMDYSGEPDLRPIMDEVVRQLSEQSSRAGRFAEYFEEWKNPNVR